MSAEVRRGSHVCRLELADNVEEGCLHQFLSDLVEFPDAAGGSSAGTVAACRALATEDMLLVLVCDERDVRIVRNIDEVGLNVKGDASLRRVSCQAVNFLTLIFAFCVSAKNGVTSFVSSSQIWNLI